MANPELEAFLRQAKGDPTLREQLGRCPNLNAIDLVRHQAKATLQLSPAELEAVAAGVALQGHLWLMTIVWH